MLELGVQRLAKADRQGGQVRALGQDRAGHGQAEQAEGLVVEIDLVIQWRTIAGHQGAHEAVGAAVLAQIEIEAVLQGLFPRAVPAQQAGDRVGIDLPGLDPGAARRLDRRSVQGDLLEEPAVDFVGPDLPPDREGVIQGPGLEIVAQAYEAGEIIGHGQLLAAGSF